MIYQFHRDSLQEMKPIYRIQSIFKWPFQRLDCPECFGHSRTVHAITALHNVQSLTGLSSAWALSSTRTRWSVIHSRSNRNFGSSGALLDRWHLLYSPAWVATDQSGAGLSVRGWRMVKISEAKEVENLQTPVRLMKRLLIWHKGAQHRSRTHRSLMITPNEGAGAWEVNLRR